jgi:hypothetical protein
VTDNGRVRVALDVCAPLPARGVRVAGANVLGLETFEFLLVAKLVGLERVWLVELVEAEPGIAWGNGPC